MLNCHKYILLWIEMLKIEKHNLELTKTHIYKNFSLLSLSVILHSFDYYFYLLCDIWKTLFESQKTNNFPDIYNFKCCEWFAPVVFFVVDTRIGTIHQQYFSFQFSERCMMCDECETLLKHFLYSLYAFKEHFVQEVTFMCEDDILIKCTNICTSTCFELGIPALHRQSDIIF